MNPTVLAALNTAYEQISALIVSVTAQPNMTFSENGRSVSQTEYLATLLDKQEVLLKGIQMASGPFTIRA